MAAPSAGRFWVVIPAAGSGSRFGSATPKQYQRLGDRTVLERTLGLFTGHADVLGIVLALSPDDAWWPALEHVDRTRIRTVAGGAERCHSVLNALRALEGEAQAEDVVAVHDAARPCLTPAALGRVAEAALNHPVGALLALPVADTLKRAQENGEVAGTLDRAGLWQAQTPQVFRFGLLRDALADALARPGGAAAITDESSALEAAGHRPLLVHGEATNLKITRAGDLDLAARILGVQATS